MNENQTNAPDHELMKRVEQFNTDLIPLLKKYNLGLGAIAFLTPDGRIAAKPQVFDDSKHPTQETQNAQEAPTEVVEG